MSCSADAYDWPLPGFLDYLAAHGAGPRLLFVLVTVAPSIALLLASERLAPDLASDYDLRRFLIRSRRCIQKEIAARRSSASAD
ncbi:MAG TPA: hypothetical protein VKT99_11490 [Xanthobacteraceae bacterium]|jgi:hypothetical protein|nr:hypothetical protein [Xanthobacteraceae bacterium]